MRTRTVLFDMLYVICEPVFERSDAKNVECYVFCILCFDQVEVFFERSGVFARCGSLAVQPPQCNYDSSVVSSLT